MISYKWITWTIDFSYKLFSIYQQKSVHQNFHKDNIWSSDEINTQFNQNIINFNKKLSFSSELEEGIGTLSSISEKNQRKIRYFWRTDYKPVAVASEVREGGDDRNCEDGKEQRGGGGGEFDVGDDSGDRSCSKWGLKRGVCTRGEENKEREKEACIIGQERLFFFLRLGFMCEFSRDI